MGGKLRRPALGAAMGAIVFIFAGQTDDCAKNARLRAFEAPGLCPTGVKRDAPALEMPGCLIPPALYFVSPLYPHTSLYPPLPSKTAARSRAGPRLCTRTWKARAARLAPPSPSPLPSTATFKPPKTQLCTHAPYSWAMGAPTPRRRGHASPRWAWTRQPGAKGAGFRHCRP